VVIAKGTNSVGSTDPPVGARLAGEGGLSANNSAACDAAFAGKPAPTGDPYVATKSVDAIDPL